MTAITLSNINKRFGEKVLFGITRCILKPESLSPSRAKAEPEKQLS